MKLSWLSQFRIWSALDGSKHPNPPPPQSPEASNYLRLATELDHLLKQPPHSFERPAGLHEHIMSRVRASASRPSPPTGTARNWVWVYAAAACLLGLAAWLALERGQGFIHLSQNLQPESNVKPEDRFAVPAEWSRAALAPLTEELELVNADVLNAANRVLASLP